MRTSHLFSRLALVAAAAMPLSGCESLCKDEAKEAAMAEATAKVEAMMPMQAAMDMATANKAVVMRYIDEIANQGKMDVADEIIDAGYSLNDATSPTGPGAVKGAMTMWRTAFPDMKLSVLHQAAEGDKVITFFNATGTHQGDLMGMAPTGKAVNVNGTFVVQMANGKIAKEWEVYDQAGMMSQLMPPAAPAKKK